MGTTNRMDEIQSNGTNTPTVKMRFRANTVIRTIMLVFAIAIVIRLFVVSVMENQKYQIMADNYHFGTMTVEAQRGSIYDATGTPLAWSATVYNVYIDPELFREEMEDVEKSNKAKEQDSKKKDKSDVNIINIPSLKSNIAMYLSKMLEVPVTDITDAYEAKGRYYVLQTQVEKGIADEIVNYFDNLNLLSFATEATTRRYYPQEELAASVIGFTDGDGNGQYGLEYQYDSYLSGIDGRIISAQAANGEEMPYRYSTTYPAKDGDSLYLTLDTTMQYYLEKSLSEMVTAYQVQERACGIIMNPKTGAIYAMATYPSFDLNHPYDIYDEATAANISQYIGEEYTDAYLNAREKQWKNKAISEIYFPGSVFKVLTTAEGFEEQVINLVNDSFYCSGYFTVLDKKIGCSDRSGHGTQTFTEALTHSCNPAFMEIGLRLGIHTFANYFDAFGLTEKSGIDLPAESNSLYIPGEDMSNVDLASSSFGQANKITPIQMITAYAAAINGGYLLQPYTVEKIMDVDGNIVEEYGANVRRQVVSEETSKIVREQLEQVVATNPGYNAYIEGYRIGGKSGTSEKLDEYGDGNMQYVASYCCFAPADDPEVILLMMADQPTVSINYYGSAVVTPYAKVVMEEILPYLGLYSDTETISDNATVPLVVNSDVENAETTLSSLGLRYQVVGYGDTVVTQLPASGSIVRKGGVVYLYTQDNIPAEQVEVPNVMGMSAAYANEALAEMGLNVVLIGAASDNANVTVQFQSEAPGTMVDMGTVVTLTMSEGLQSD